MLAKRVIPCLDVHDRQVTRGVKFGLAEKGQLRNVGDPVALAVEYNRQGADEMVFYDITASAHGRRTMVEVIEEVASQCFMPLTVGGGVRSVDEMRAVLRAGADKVSFNTAAVAEPELLTACAERFGSQAVVCAIDARRLPPVEGTAPRWEVVTYGGRQPTELEAVAWAVRVVELGAGELLVTSMDRDGTGSGFDTDLLAAIAGRVRVPVIASGGAAGPDDFVAAVRDGKADAVLAATIFHRRTHSIADVKSAMAAAGLPVRRTEEWAA